MSSHIHIKDANQFDAIRSYQKDQYYINKQNIAIKNIFNYFHDSNRNFNDELDFLSDLFYYSLTNLLNRQTIGQESYNLILYNPRLKNVPNIFNRVTHLLLRSLLPYIFNKIINVKINNSNISINLKTYFMLAKTVFFYLKEIYKIKYFFNNNNYYDLENKISNIKLLTLNNKTNINLNKYKLLGVLKSITLVVYASNQIKMLISYISKSNQKNSINKIESKQEIVNINDQIKKEDEKSNLKCSVCLENVKGPTVTNCGHIFCWLCIQRYINNFNKSLLNSGNSQIACPSCRIHFNPNKLVYLYNYN